MKTMAHALMVSILSILTRPSVFLSMQDNCASLRSVNAHTYLVQMVGSVWIESTVMTVAVLLAIRVDIVNQSLMSAFHHLARTMEAALINSMIMHVNA